MALDRFYKADRSGWRAIASGYYGDNDIYAPEKVIDDVIGQRNLVYVSRGGPDWVQVGIKLAQFVVN